ncbi:FAD-binding oxidoreductase [Acidianus manzaensis]|uniref:FAD-binding oxidoreductase n=1 Tax=Acidianus manzaensis TaxID=282676 RepID=UPI00164F949A|nr:FAD-binding oxidoreductase [Acidianus manzaensis]
MDYIKELKKRFKVATDLETRERYSKDYGFISPKLSKFRKIADAVVWLYSEEEIKEFFKIQQDYHFYIVERGNGTNTLGGAMPIKEKSVIVIPEMKKFEVLNGKLISDPSVEFNDLDVSSLPVYPTSFNMATIGGFVAGGSLGIGSLKYGAVWDNVNMIKVVNQKGEYTFYDNDVKKVVQSAGTVGIITKIGFRLIKRDKIVVKNYKFKKVGDAINKALDLIDEAEFISIRSKEMAYNISNENWDNWNLIVGFPGEDGKPVTSADIITTFAGAYFTVVNKKKVSYYSVDVKIEDLEKLDKIKGMIDCELARSQGKLFSHTYFLGFSEIPLQNEKVFNLHSYKINDRVEEDRLKKIIDFKKVVDPEDYINPGKIEY